MWETEAERGWVGFEADEGEREGERERPARAGREREVGEMVGLAGQREGMAECERRRQREGG